VPPPCTTCPPTVPQSLSCLLFFSCSIHDTCQPQFISRLWLALLWRAVPPLPSHIDTVHLLSLYACLAAKHTAPPGFTNPLHTASQTCPPAAHFPQHLLYPSASLHPQAVVGAAVACCTSTPHTHRHCAAAVTVLMLAFQAHLAAPPPCQQYLNPCPACCSCPAASTIPFSLPASTGCGWRCSGVLYIHAPGAAPGGQPCPYPAPYPLVVFTSGFLVRTCVVFLTVCTTSVWLQSSCKEETWLSALHPSNYMQAWMEPLLLLHRGPMAGEKTRPNPLPVGNNTAAAPPPRPPLLPLTAGQSHDPTSPLHAWRAAWLKSEKLMQQLCMHSSCAKAKTSFALHRRIFHVFPARLL
jgi:hypothetical protein